MKKVEYCTGIGLNMLFPEYHTVYLVDEDDIDDDFKPFTNHPIETPQLDLVTPWEEHMEHA